MTHVHLPLTPSWLLFPVPWVWALLLLALVPVMWWWWQRPSRRSVLRFSDVSIALACGAGWRRQVRSILPALRMAVLSCLIIAVARPQRPDESSLVYAEGIAIQMVVDTSGSMADEDLSPPGKRLRRIDVVKDVFRRFVMGDDELPGRPNDLIGMIKFALYPDSVCPLTLDHQALLEVLDQTDLVQWREENFTAIGDALALAVERMKNIQRTSGSGQQYTIASRIIILLTDGENNAGQIDPEQAGNLAAACGIRVYTILAGTGELRGFFRAPVNDRPLRHIAEVTGGKFFHATDREALVKIYAEIDRMERTRTEERRFVRWGDLSTPFLVAALCGVGLHTLLEATWLRKIP
jgi:Ca-activated chloride channel family protein